ncbi:hypothetical protein [Candidatus Methylacidithermus pantelleriae]|uniref:Uncharacterized protein n=1 Tax=Candidatus Methylacidithermus pantelleriae TaxID=2744239 RepID=A0A8J2BVC3_9BACT|nr:hypothetical protein [Candidatus Methylacidithermus pantelleriae]CAF0703684.1 conserved hypothetical protein [Candidatus Methylacidithermus pantelleriae]
MAFSVVSKKSGKTYYLHGRDQVLRNGLKVRLYYFSTKVGEGVLDSLPDGYEVAESDRTGLPILRKRKGAPS